MKEEKIDMVGLANDLLGGKEKKYDNSRDLLRFIMDIAQTNSDISETDKWKNEWKFIVIEIDEFLNG